MTIFIFFGCGGEGGEVAVAFFPIEKDSNVFKEKFEFSKFFFQLTLDS